MCWLLQVFQRQMSKEGLQKVVDKEQSTDAKAQVCEPLDIVWQQKPCLFRNKATRASVAYVAALGMWLISCWGLGLSFWVGTNTVHKDLLKLSHFTVDVACVDAIDLLSLGPEPTKCNYPWVNDRSKNQTLFLTKACNQRMQVNMLSTDDLRDLFTLREDIRYWYRAD